MPQHLSDPEHTLVDYLQGARKAAGSPSLRAIAARTEFSHTTVAKALTADEAPVSWQIVEQVSAAVGADTATAHALWLGVNEGETNLDLVGGASVQPSMSPRPFALVVWMGVLFVGGVSVIVSQAVTGDSGHAVFVTDLIQAVFMWAAAATFAARAHTAGDRANRAFLMLLATGVSAWACGQTAWFISRNIYDQAMPGTLIHDIGFLLMPPLVGAALWLQAGHYRSAPWNTPLGFIRAFMSFTTCAYAASILLLTVVHLRTDGLILLYALYPATDIALSIVALAPLLVRRRRLQSALLSVALLAASASDFGYLVLKANPATESITPAAALGYVAFAVIAAICAFIVKPLPGAPAHDALRDHPRIKARDTATGATAGSAALAVICASIVVWKLPSTPTSAVLLIVVVLISTSLALSSFQDSRGRREVRID